MKKAKQKKKSGVLILLVFAACLTALGAAVFYLQLMEAPKLGQDCLQKGESKSAEKHFEAYLKFNELILHHETATEANCLFGLARCYFDRGRFTDALAAFNQAHQIRTRVLGPENEETFLVDVSLITLKCHQDPNLDGLHELGDLLNIAKARFGENSYAFEFVSDSLGNWCLEHERFNLAEQYLSKAAKLDNVFMDSHEPLLSGESLAMALFTEAEKDLTKNKSKTLARAQSTLDEMIPKLQAAYGQDSANLFMPYEIRGLVLLGQGDKDKAIIELDRAYALGSKLVKEGKIYESDIKDLVKR